MTLEIKVTASEDTVNAGTAGDYIARALGSLGYFQSTQVATSIEQGVSAKAVEKVVEADKPAEPAKRGRKKAEPAASEPAPQIQTNPEDRVGPEDTPEAQAQDAADEAAEGEAYKEGALTIDDVRVATAAYTKKFGMAKAQAELPKILGCAPAQVAEADYATAIAKIKGAVTASETDEDDPFGFGGEAGSAAKAPEATQQELLDAMRGFVERTGDKDKAAAGGQDIFTKVLGPVPAGLTDAKGQPATIWKVSVLPDDAAVRGKLVALFSAGGAA